MDQKLDENFYYLKSCECKHPVRIKIGTLEGNIPKPSAEDILKNPWMKYAGLNQEGLANLKLVCRVYDERLGRDMRKTATFKTFTNRYSWNEWLFFSFGYNAVMDTTRLAITIYDSEKPFNSYPVGGTTVSFINEDGVFRTGVMDLKVWPLVEADPSINTTTPGEDRENSQIQKFAGLTKKHRDGHMPKGDLAKVAKQFLGTRQCKSKAPTVNDSVRGPTNLRKRSGRGQVEPKDRVEWLDRVVFRELENICEKEKRSTNCMYLSVEFPTFDLNGKHHEIVYYLLGSDVVQEVRRKGTLVTVPDTEILKENLCEDKHHKLSRSVRSTHLDRDAKANVTVRNELAKIVAYPPTRVLTSEEQDQVWKYRYYLSSQKKALTKFLKCVKWTETGKESGEVNQALSMLGNWAPMDVEDALELLSQNFTNPVVRQYAISKLEQAPDEDLLLYLLQLVQALKYEDIKRIEDAYLSALNAKEVTDDSKGSTTLENSLNKMSLDETRTSQTDSVSDDCAIMEEKLLHGSLESGTTETLQGNLQKPDLASFLIQRACKSLTLANYLYWYLIIECEDTETIAKQDKASKSVKEMYSKVLKIFTLVLSKGSKEFKVIHETLKRQRDFINNLVLLVKTVSRESGNRQKKIEKLQQLLSNPDAFKWNFTNFSPLPLPLDPEVKIKSIVAESASLFKSALTPTKLHFRTTENTEYVAIFKYGDDLRQDQLILQMITLIDKLLRKENLDLKLTPYRVLATSSKHGLLQFIDSITVAEAVQSEGSIQNFFRKHHPHPTAPYNIAPEIMNTYISSCAGYSIITYLLGVGDRHLDNLLLTTSGKLFHIDFGYILGRDPKLMEPPPMKLSKEMIDAMGGINSEHYKEFLTQCYTAFLHLRRHGNLILNLFSLMVDASIPDIVLEPDKMVKKLQEKLALESTDEEAVQYVQHVITFSLSSFIPGMIDRLHTIAQFLRK